MANATINLAVNGCAKTVVNFVILMALIVIMV